MYAPVTDIIIQTNCYLCQSFQDDDDDMKPEVEDPLLSILRPALGAAALAPASDFASQSVASISQGIQSGSGFNRFAALGTGRVPRVQQPRAQKIEPVPALASAPGLGRERVFSLSQTPASLPRLKGVPLSGSQPPRAAEKAPAPAEIPQQNLFPVPALASRLQLLPHAMPGLEADVLSDGAVQPKLGTVLQAHVDTTPGSAASTRPHEEASPVAGKALAFASQPQLKEVTAPEGGAAPLPDPSPLAAKHGIASPGAALPHLRRPSVKTDSDTDDADDEIFRLAFARASGFAPKAPSRQAQPRAPSPDSLYRYLALMTRLSSRLAQRSSDSSSEE